MPRTIGIDTMKVSAEHQYRATCLDCGYTVVRSTRESAQHIVAQHVSYQHQAEVEKAAK